MLRVYRIPFSTNVERVALAAAHKEIPIEWIDVDPADRSPVVAASGQELVPVLDHDGRIVCDSTAILHYLDELEPARELLADAPDRALRRLVQPRLEGATERDRGGAAGAQRPTRRGSPSSARR